MSTIGTLIERYKQGPSLLRQAIAVMSAERMDARPIAGRWSTREVVCHIVDFDQLYADRMKRVIAEKEPDFSPSEPDAFAAHLAYAKRDVARELELLTLLREQMAVILESLPEEAFRRAGRHSVRGLVTLQELLQAITDHIPHHIRFIEEKKAALGLHTGK
jgi:uncharacterized damage-inducible protein DinB